MNTIAITGASGFIGKHLVAELIRIGGRRIKVLSRSRRQDFGASVEIVEGDVRDREALRELVEPGCTVINLAYLPDEGVKENLDACASLLEACRAANVRRLIHCSTASVVGRSSDDLVTESTTCHPVTEYGNTKLEIERAILAAAQHNFEAIILRPAAVFGAGGENLKKLTGELTTNSRLQNYLRSCLFGNRRMNLVYVVNVVASILFLVDHKKNLGGEVFNISDADSQLNNFADVERILMRELDIPSYSCARIPVPQGVLALLLSLLGRDNVNPRCDYFSARLIALGFERPVDFEAGLKEYAAWYRSGHHGGQ